MNPSNVTANTQERFLGPIYAYKVTGVAAQPPKNSQPTTADTAFPWVQEQQNSPRQIHGPGLFGPFSPPLRWLVAFAGPGAMGVEVCDDKTTLDDFLKAGVAASSQQPGGQALVSVLFPNPLTPSGFASQRGPTAGVGNDVGYAPQFGDDGVALGGALKLRVFVFPGLLDGGVGLAGCSFVPWLFDPDMNQWVPDNNNVVVVADQTGGLNLATFGAATMLMFDFTLDETKRQKLSGVALDSRIYFQPINPSNAAVVKMAVQIQRLA